MLLSTIIAPMFVMAQSGGQGNHFYITPLQRTALKFGHGTPTEIIQGRCGITSRKSTPMTVFMKNGMLPITFTKVKASNSFIVDVRLQIAAKGQADFPNFDMPPVIRAVTLGKDVASGDVSLNVSRFMSGIKDTYTWVQIVAYDSVSGRPIEKHCYPVYLRK